MAAPLPEAKRESTQRWTEVIATYTKEFKPWEVRVEKLLKRYRDERPDQRNVKARFNILWANVQTLVPAVFSKIPKPDVSRRFRDNDPTGRVASLILERSLEYETEHYPDYYATIRQCVYDRFLGGRGTAWVRYEPHIMAKPKKEPVDGEQVTDDIDEPEEQLDYECAPTDYVHWKDFGHTRARTWEEVPQVWRCVYMRMPAKVERFGKDLAKTIPKDAPPKDSQDRKAEGDTTDGSWIYELWDKDTKQVFWFHKEMPTILDVKPDPLKLEGFFPCPRPLYATLTNETLVPVPDFTLYQDQARELDTLAERIDGLIGALQVRGVHDAAIPELARIFTETSNGQLIPVKNWAAFAEKNGLAGGIDIVDLKPIYEALRAAYEAMAQVMKQIYDLTGLADIVRGQSNANETAAAQKLKGQYASLRLKFIQYDVARFASELLQLKAQVICGQFAPQTIATMAGVEQFNQNDLPLVPNAMMLLIGQERMTDPLADSPNPSRSFRIEVNADTMVQIDEDEEKQNRLEFITAQGAFMEKALPMIQASPQVMPLVAALWKFSVGAFKVGKTLEGEFDAMIDKAKQAAAQPQQTPPDPDMERVKAERETQTMRVQADQQANAAKLQFEQQKTQMEQQAREREAQFQQQIEEQKMQHQSMIAQQEREAQEQFDRWKAELEANTKIVVAEIAAKSSIKQTSMTLNANKDPLTEADDEGNEKPIDPLLQLTDAINKNMMELMNMHSQSHAQLVEAMQRPKTVMRGLDGRVIGVQ